jgi:hypothetical protein
VAVGICISVVAYYIVGPAKAFVQASDFASPGECRSTGIRFDSKDRSASDHARIGMRRGRSREGGVIMTAIRKKLGPIAVAAGLFVISAVSAGRGSLAAEGAASNELEQVTVNMLDTAAMSTAMTSFVQKELIARAANTRQAAEVERMFPGFNGRVQSRIAMEMRDTILHHIQGLRHQYEDLLRVSLTPEDIRALLNFQADPIFSRLEDHALADSLSTAGSNGAEVARQMLAQMLPQQRELTARFLETDAGRKFVALGPQLEALKSRWQQDVTDEVADRMPAIADTVLGEYEQRAHDR